MTTEVMYDLNIEIINEKNNYIKIITINEQPEGILNELVKRIKSEKLSPFEEDKGCKYVILNPYNKNQYLEIKDVIVLMNYLQRNSYIINIELTDMMKKVNKSNKELLFYISYYV